MGELTAFVCAGRKAQEAKQKLKEKRKQSESISGGESVDRHSWTRSREEVGRLN